MMLRRDGAEFCKTGLHSRFGQLPPYNGISPRLITSYLGALGGFFLTLSCLELSRAINFTVYSPEI